MNIGKLLHLTLLKHNGSIKIKSGKETFLPEK